MRLLLLFFFKVNFNFKFNDKSEYCRCFPGELMALRLITFWNPYGITLSPQTKSTIQLARNRAVNELYRWYSDQHFESADTRLGNVLLLLCPITVSFFLPYLKMSHLYFGLKSHFCVVWIYKVT